MVLVRGDLSCLETTDKYGTMMSSGGCGGLAGFLLLPRDVIGDQPAAVSLTEVTSRTSRAVVVSSI